jgi:hypothetical protein
MPQVGNGYDFFVEGNRINVFKKNVFYSNIVKQVASNKSSLLLKIQK